jgi:hypothetical protein
MAQPQQTSIIYNYYETPIYANQYEKNLQKDGYIKLPFTSYKSETHPNLIINHQKYKTVNLYVLSNSHNTAFTGELILEHVPITNGNDKVYVCVPLKTQPGNSEQTVVDKIIAGAFRTNLEVNLNPLLVTNKVAKIVSDGLSVVYFSDPILISTPFYAFANTDNFLFPALSEYVDYDTVNIASPYNARIQEGFTLDVVETDGTDKGNHPTAAQIQSGNQLALGGDMIIDCTPVDASDDTVELIPLTTILGSANSDVATNQLLNTSLNFFSFLIVICVAVFVSPVVYRSMFVGFIDKIMDSNSDKAGNLKTLDVIIFSFFLGYCIYMVSSGLNVSNPKPVLSSVGIIFFIYLCLTTGILIMLKESNPGTYKLDRLGGMQDAPYKFDIFTMFLDLIKHEPKFVFSSLIGMLVLAGIIIYSGFISQKYMGNPGGWDKDTADNVYKIVWPVILFVVFYVSLYYKKGIRSSP